MSKSYLMIICKKCGSFVPASRFCRECGTRREKDIFKEVETTFCEVCKERVPKGKFCGVCGRPLAK